MSGLGADTTTDEVLEGVDLAGKRILITGGSSGLGEESGRALASKGALIILAARNSEKLEAAAARIREKVPGAELEQRTLDLASLDAVRSFAKDFLADHDSLDVLINNAGVMCCPQGQTVDGFETQIGTNHIGHFLLTGLLAPALIAGAPSRAICVSSGAHEMSGVDFGDPMFEHREYDPWAAYGQSKTANALFALELNRRLSGRRVSAYSLHPGMIMTELARHMTAEVMASMQERMKKRAEEMGESDPAAAMKFKSVEAGAATQVWAATAPELASHGGAYLGDCQLGIPCEAGGEGSSAGERGVSAHARDPELAARLWALSEKWVGQTFEF